MKTYKTWEMMKELTENPEKEFRSERPYSADLTTRIKDGCIQIIREGIAIERELSINNDRKWKKARRPLTFTEALEVAEEGINIPIGFEYADDESGIQQRFHGELLDEILSELAQKYHGHQIAKMLLEGKFYIE